MSALLFWLFLISTKEIFGLFGSKMMCREKASLVMQLWVPSFFTSKFGCLSLSLCHTVFLYVKYPSWRAPGKREREQVAGNLRAGKCSRKQYLRRLGGSVG